MDEAFVKSLDKTHLSSMLTMVRLGSRGDENVKYADVASGGVGMTMVVRIRGGKFARLEPAFTIFQNESRNYPIRGIPDDVPGVAYRTNP